MKRFFILLALIPVAILCIPVLVSTLFSLPGVQTSGASYLPPETLSILDPQTQTIHTLSLEDCVNRIFMNELMTGSPFEAAKAQAVATRSYLLSLIEKKLHPDCMLCNDGAHCISFSISAPPAAMHPAVAETAGTYLSYQGKPAKACYFSVSSGHTESSEDVWGVKLPYLSGTESEPDLLSASYQSRVFYPLDAFYTALKGARHGIDTTRSNIGKSETTRHGHVKEIILLGERFTGQEVQALFRLKSTNFTVENKDNQIVFTVKGDGHGVGMSKFGAKSMAENEKSYTDILSHYYPGTKLETEKREA